MQDGAKKGSILLLSAVKGISQCKKMNRFKKEFCVIPGRCLEGTCCASQEKMALGISENETLASVSIPFFEMPCGFLSSVSKCSFRRFL
jgi:hypothetical protein